MIFFVAAAAARALLPPSVRTSISYECACVCVYDFRARDVEWHMACARSTENGER